MHVPDQYEVRAGSWQAWHAATRPFSLLVAISPVLAGAALGYARTGAIDWTAFGLAFAAAVLMQLITNLQNDVGFTRRGGDYLGQRIGLPRATAQGWLALQQVHLAVVVLSFLAAMLGLALVAWRGWPVLAIGAASLAAALGYMGGRRPIAYTPFGEVVAFLFFGPVAVMGTDWLLTGSTSAQTALAACCVGALTAAALAVNNHRDQTHDQLVGRRTLAVIRGAGVSRQLVHGLVVVPFFIAPVMAAAARSLWPLLPLALGVVAWRLLRDFDRCAPGVGYNAILFRTFRLTLWFAALMSLGAVLGRPLA